MDLIYSAERVHSDAENDRIDKLRKRFESRAVSATSPFVYHIDREANIDEAEMLLCEPPTNAQSQWQSAQRVLQRIADANHKLNKSAKLDHRSPLSDKPIRSLFWSMPKRLQHTMSTASRKWTNVASSTAVPTRPSPSASRSLSPSSRHNSKRSTETNEMTPRNERSRIIMSTTNEMIKRNERTRTERASSRSGERDNYNWSVKKRSISQCLASIWLPSVVVIVGVGVIVVCLKRIDWNVIFTGAVILLFFARRSCRQLS